MRERSVFEIFLYLQEGNTLRVKGPNHHFLLKKVITIEEEENEFGVTYEEEYNQYEIVSFTGVECEDPYCPCAGVGMVQDVTPDMNDYFSCLSLSDLTKFEPIYKQLTAL
jgi:hypothetical protein